MKAAVVREAGNPPEYDDFQEPTAGEAELKIAVSAAALNHLSVGRASGRHYSSSGDEQFVVGVDGVGRLDDGRRVYFMLPRAPYGSMAEYTIVGRSQCIPVPDELDNVTAAAIANPGMSSWAALTQRAAFRAGETVLINGATGVSGRLAVQIAMHLGAGKIIVTGRNGEVLEQLRSLGADVTISLTQSPEDLERSFQEQLASTGVDVVLDYLWGPSAEGFLSAAAKAAEGTPPIRFVQIGNLSAPNITLPASALRSSTTELLGSGLKSTPLPCFLDVIGKLFHLMIEARLDIRTRAVPLSEVGSNWSMANSAERTVFVVR